MAAKRKRNYLIFIIMTKAESFFEEMAKGLSGVETGKMFGARCLKTPNGKSAAMFWQDNIVVKLSGEAFANAMSLAGARQFAPMEGRPMKEWVQIPFKHHTYWKEYVEISIAGVRVLDKKLPKKKK